MDNVIHKIVIPFECKHRIIEELDLLNISSKAVFPGFDGIGRYTAGHNRNSHAKVGMGVSGNRQPLII